MTYAEALKVLELSTNATPDEIKRAYRRMAHKYHPDKNPNDKTAADRFHQITMAYDVLNGRGNQTASSSSYANMADFAEKMCDAMEMSALALSLEGTEKGSFASFEIFIHMAQMRAERKYDAQFQAQFEQLRKTMISIMKARKFVKCSYITALSCLVFMLIYNLSAGHGSMYPGIIIYPLAGVSVCAGAIAMDAAAKKLRNSVPTMRTIFEKVR